jgi:hypothetical protein
VSWCSTFALSFGSDVHFVNGILVTDALVAAVWGHVKNFQEKKLLK